MKSIDQVFTDDYTYCYRETLFVTEDATHPKVFEELRKSFKITEDQFIELNCDGAVVVKDNCDSNVKLELNHIKVV